MKGDKDMDYRIVEKEDFTVYGKSVQVTCQDNKHFRQISKFWEECQQDGIIAKLSSISKDDYLLGIMLNPHTYMIACRADLPSYEDGFTLITIPASSWAIFHSIGQLPGAIQNLFVKIYQEGLEFKHSEAPVIEVYPPGDVTAEDYHCEVWIPILKK